MTKGADSRERMWLLRALRTSVRDRQLRAPDDPFDWQSVLSIAEAHGLSPLLAANLSAAGAHPPAHVERELERRHLETVARNLTFTSQLAGVLRILHARGIRAVAFKGPTLGVLAYGRAAPRTFVDLDVLVPRDSFREVRRILSAEGYETERDRVLDGVYPQAGREDAYIPPQPQWARVEVHVSIAPWALAVRFDLAGMLHRAIEVDVAGRRILTLHPDDLILAVAVHGLAHRWSFLKHVSEMDGLSQAALDWDAVIARADAARMRRILAVAVLLARELFDTPWPREVVGMAEDDAHARALAVRLAGNIFDPPLARKVNPGQWALFVRSRESRADQLRYCGRALFMEWILKMPWHRVLPART